VRRLAGDEKSSRKALSHSPSSENNGIGFRQQSYSHQPHYYTNKREEKKSGLSTRTRKKPLDLLIRRGLFCPLGYRFITLSRNQMIPYLVIFFQEIDKLISLAPSHFFTFTDIRTVKGLLCLGCFKSTPCRRLHIEEQRIFMRPGGQSLPAS
jgi:hypothetical protein